MASYMHEEVRRNGNTTFANHRFALPKSIAPHHVPGLSVVTLRKHHIPNWVSGVLVYVDSVTISRRRRNAAKDAASTQAKQRN
jgi:hypothetical protein